MVTEHPLVPMRADIVKLLMVLSEMERDRLEFVSIDYMQEKLLAILANRATWHHCLHKAYKEMIHES